MSQLVSSNLRDTRPAPRELELEMPEANIQTLTRTRGCSFSIKGVINGGVGIPSTRTRSFFSIV